MSIPLKVGNVTYNYPSNQDEGWGADASNWALAITQNTLQKTGGLFTLTAPLDFGPNYGIKALYFQSRSASIATSGQIRLAHNESVSFRNFADIGDLAFSPNPLNDTPQWNGVDLVDISSIQTLTNKTLTSPILNTPTITGASVSGGTFTSAILTSSTVSNNLSFGGAIFDALASFTLADNISSPSPIFTFPIPGNENIVVEYSIQRNGNKEIGNIFITTDGITAQVAPGSLNLATTGIIFSADISGGSIRLLYISTNTGFTGTMKYLTRRWAD